MNAAREPKKPLDVKVSSVAPAVQDAISHRAWKREIINTISRTVIAVASILGPCWIAYMQYRTREAVESGTAIVHKQTKEVAKELETYNETQGTKLDDLTDVVHDTNETGFETHVLVNSAALISARLYASALRRLVELENDPADIEELKRAQEAVLEHEKGQKALDARLKKPKPTTSKPPAQQTSDVGS